MTTNTIDLKTVEVVTEEDSTVVATVSAVDTQYKSSIVTEGYGSVGVDVYSNENTVETVKKEYSIVGDGLYTSLNTDIAPPWLHPIVDLAVKDAVDNRYLDVDNIVSTLGNALDLVQAAKNTYEETVNIVATIDGVIVSKLETINASFEDSKADIINIKSTMATQDFAASTIAQRLDAEINGGSIKARLDSYDFAIANVEQSIAGTLTNLEAEYEGISNAMSSLENVVEATATGAMANFAYNANLTLNGYSYNSGFGLATHLTSGSGIPVGDSEFWVNADRFRFSDSNGASLPVFSIDSLSREAVFRGKVIFKGGTVGTIDDVISDVNGYTDSALQNVNVQEYINTNNNLFAQAQGFANYADMQNRYIQLGTTIIDGGFIRTGLIDTDTLVAKNVAASVSLSSPVISGGSLSIGSASNGQKRFDVQANGTMTIRDGAGNIILSSGSSAAIPASAVSGLGSLATKSQVGPSEIAPGAVGITQFGTVIQSTNYDEIIKTGWRITRDGDATFFGYLKAQGLGEVNIESSSGLSMPSKLLNHSWTNDVTTHNLISVEKPFSASSWDALITFSGVNTTNTGDNRDFVVKLQYQVSALSYPWSVLGWTDLGGWWPSTGSWNIHNSVLGGVGNLTANYLHVRAQMGGFNSGGTVQCHTAVLKVVRGV